MPFISLKPRKRNDHGKKLPPPSAWGHYRVRREKYAAVRYSESKNRDKRTLISIENVGLGYGDKTILKGLGFSVKEGDHISIIGDNGTGKSTLLRALLSLKHVGEGKINFLSVKMGEIGYLPQQNNTRADFPVTVYEVVLTGCLDRCFNGPFVTKEAKRIAFSNMEKLGITSLSDRPFGALSGGQRQRVMLARALCAAKKILILDEPVTGLDPKTAEDIYSLIDDLNRNRGMTVVSVTHDIRAALRYSTHILRLSSDGCFFGTVGEYLALPESVQYTEEQKNIDMPPYGESGFRYSGGAT